MAHPRAHARPSTGAALLVLLLKTVWLALVIATPLLSAWAASSLAAYHYIGQVEANRED
jgi:hypothetical protein